MKASSAPLAWGLILVLAPLSLASEPRSWYVSPTGNDAAAGTLEQPFATLQRAQQSVQPGDTVWLRGGTYRIREDQLARRRGLYATIFVLDQSGTPDAPISYRAFEQERPVFDCSLVKPEGKRVSAFLVRGSWLRIDGIGVTGVQVTMRGHTQSICFESRGSHNRFERLEMHDGQAIGIYHLEGSDNLFLNCDAWNNWDFTSENGRGGNVDGFGCHPSPKATGNVFRGCRAWFNSDDGFDCISAHEAVTFENCWALYNGFSPKFERLADGNGFKAGGYGSIPAQRLPAVIPRHVVRDCVAVGNKNGGFYANHHPGGIDWLNNRAYQNGTDFNMRCRLTDNRTEADGYGHRLIGNLTFGSPRPLAHINRDQCELSGNWFPPEHNFGPGDFWSVAPEDLLRPRQPDGSLPEQRFLQRRATP